MLVKREGPLQPQVHRRHGAGLNGQPAKSDCLVVLQQWRGDGRRLGAVRKQHKSLVCRRLVLVLVLLLLLLRLSPGL